MRRIWFVVVFASVLLVGPAFAQHGSEAQPQHATEQPGHQPAPGQQEIKKEAHSPQGAGAALDAAAEDAATPGHVEEEDEHAVFKYSASVKWFAGMTGLSVQSAYWIFLGLNFAILFGALFFIMRSKLPAAFRSRTELIRKQMDEAQKASADANRRLSDIESRLSRLDTEISELRAQAERDAAAEEQRIREAAEQDKRKIVEGAEQEIAAAAKVARRDLKAYAADLAVALAEKRIRVDATTDQELVRSFVDQLGNGKDGR